MLDLIHDLEFDNRDLDDLGQYLALVIDGSFFEDWEFGTLIGVTREELRDIAKKLSFENKVHSKDIHAIHSALGNLIGYPHGLENSLKTVDVNFETAIRLLINKIASVENHNR